MSTQYIPRLILEAGSVTVFDSGDTYIIEVYITGDWNGTSASHTVISASNTSANIILPHNITLNYADLKNIIVSGDYKIFCNSGTCVDLGGNNVNVVYGDYLPSTEVVISTNIDGSIVNVVKINVDGSTVYVCCLEGTNLIFKKKYFDSSNAIIGTNATIL